MDTIPQDALDEDGIGAHNRRTRAQNQPQALGLALGLIIAADAREQRLDRKVFDMRLHHACVEPGDVEQGIEETVHRGDRTADVLDQAPCLVIHCVPLPGADQEPKGVDRLAQIVARGGEEA